MSSKLWAIIVVLVLLLLAVSGCELTFIQSSCEHVAEMVGFMEVTCLEDGFTGKQICTKCGLVLYEGEIVPKLDHYPTTQGQEGATCAQEGYTGDLVCLRCQTLIEKGTVTEKIPHEPITVGSVEATFTEEGYSGDSVCQICNTVLVKGQILPLRKPQEGDNLGNGIYIPWLQDPDRDIMKSLMEQYRDRVFADPNGTVSLFFTNGETNFHFSCDTDDDTIIEYSGSVIKTTRYNKYENLVAVHVDTEEYDEEGNWIRTRLQSYDKAGDLLMDEYRTYKRVDAENIVTYKKGIYTQKFLDGMGQPYAPTEVEVRLTDDSIYTYTRTRNGETVEYGTYMTVGNEYYLLHSKGSFHEYTVTYNADMVVVKIIHSIESIGEYGEYFYNEANPADRYYVRVNWLENGQLVTYTEETSKFGVTSVERTDARIPGDSFP